jgi:hypothetical protein
MKYTNAISAALAALALSAATPPTVAAEIGSDTGAPTGSAVFYDVTSGTWFDPASGGGIQVGDIIRTFYQGVLGNIAPADLGLSDWHGKSEITITASFDQTVESVTATGRGTNSYVAHLLSGGSVNIYFDNNPARFADIAKGSGFTDGILLATGTLRSGATGGTLTLFDNARKDRASGSNSFIADLSWIGLGDWRGHGDKLSQLSGAHPDLISFSTALSFGCEYCGDAQTGMFFGKHVPRSHVFAADGTAVFGSTALMVPEPGTISLMLGGLVFLGGVAARRRPR